MPESNPKRSSEGFILLIVCVFSLTLGLVFRPGKVAVAKSTPSKILQQSDEKTIENAQFGNEPFEFSDLSIQNIAINPRQKINISSLVEKNGGKVDDWLENLKFTLKNISGKRIIYIALALDFPETKVNGPMMVYNQLGFGIHPMSTEDQKQHISPLVFEPNSTLTFTLTDRKLESVKSFLATRKLQLADINKVVIRVDYLIFDDGMKWQIGRFYKPNPNRPSGYEQINPNTQ